MDPMSLLTPSTGLIFWTAVVFTLLIILLKKFAWTPIINSVDERNKTIEEALSSANKAREEMEQLNADNNRILKEAREERDNILKEAKTISEKMVMDAKEKASQESDKILTSTREQIKNEKMKALTELKNHVADLSIEIAEKILKNELKNPKQQQDLIGASLKEAELN